MESVFLLSEIDTEAALFLKSIGDKKLIAFNGSMGAGKTTFIGAVCRQLQVKDTISSPTYSIINEYTAADGSMLYHIDLYRVKILQEAIDAGVEEYFYSNNFCFVEWPEKAMQLFPEHTLYCYIESIADNKRKLKINL